MIERLQIKNFRTHKKLDLTFSPLVNSIIGPNYAGKSTIIRAIRWVARNKPAGENVINWDAEKAAVRLTIDGNKITRIRSKSINTYQLNKKKPYKAFRNEVPKDIEKTINLSDINFQGQHEAPFWFCETAGEVSRQLNNIINLEIIDKTLANIASALRKSHVTIEVIENRLDKIILQQKSLAYIEDLNENLKGVENLQIQYQKKASELTTLRDILKLALSYRNKAVRIRTVASGAVSVLNKGSKYQKIMAQIENLSKSVKLGVRLQKVISIRPPSLNTLEKLKKRMQQTSNQYESLDDLIDELKTYEGEKCQAEGDLKKCKRELEKIAGGRCPLCGSAMKK